MLATVVVISGCSPSTGSATRGADNHKYERAFDSKNDLLVFQSDALDGGPIKGAIQAGDPTIKWGTVQMLQEALITCGETRIVLDMSWTHNEYVHVPLKINNPLREMTDLQLVDCVRQNTSFAFFAGIGRGPDADPAPFESLHAKKN